MMRPVTMYKQGDIVLIPFPYSDLSENKQRPALIISNELINETEDRICCLITKNARRDDMIIKKEDFQTGTLPFKSFFRPQRIFTIHQGIIKKKLCTINRDFHNKIIDKLCEYVKGIN